MIGLRCKFLIIAGLGTGILCRPSCRPMLNRINGAQATSPDHRILKRSGSRDTPAIQRRTRSRKNSPTNSTRTTRSTGQCKPFRRPRGNRIRQALPQTLTLPAGTVIRVRTDEWISSDRNAIGDNFSAVLDEPIVVNGWVVARRGQAQTGRVSVGEERRPRQRNFAARS